MLAHGLGNLRFRAMRRFELGGSDRRSIQSGFALKHHFHGVLELS
jgi:hypothetical protein